jgi:alpha-tubulin suppressor-like RCC1 family protein
VTYGLSDDGVLYVHGDDKNETGRLGVDAFTVYSPRMLPFREAVSSVSCGNTHAAAVVNGQLYTWGTGSCGQLGFADKTLTPKPVPSATIFSIKQVVCGMRSTNVLTHGGYVYTYGVISDHKRLSWSARANYEPYTIPDFERYFIRAVKCGDRFNVFVTDTGEVYAYDNCFEVVRLPVTKEIRIDQFVVAGERESVVYGLPVSFGFLDSEEMYEWRIDAATCGEVL